MLDNAGDSPFNIHPETTSHRVHYYHPCTSHKQLLPKLGPWPLSWSFFFLFCAPLQTIPYTAARSSCHFPAGNRPMVSKRPWSLLGHQLHLPLAPSHGSFLLGLECAYRALLSAFELGVIQREPRSPSLFLQIPL